MYFAKVFEVVNGAALQKAVNDWFKRHQDIEIVSVTQSEVLSTSDLRGITLTIIYKA